MVSGLNAARAVVTMQGELKAWMRVFKNGLVYQYG